MCTRRKWLEQSKMFTSIDSDTHMYIVICIYSVKYYWLTLTEKYEFNFKKLPVLEQLSGCARNLNIIMVWALTQVL